MRGGRRQDYAPAMKANHFRIVPLPSAVAEEARRIAHTGAPDHRTMTVEEPHTAPCRHCLRWAEPGERVILFPYQSIAPGQPYAESGPIFVHENACPAYDKPQEFPDQFRRGRTLRAYNERNEIAEAEVVTGEPEPVIERMFADPAVRFLHVRSATRGCYTFKVERA